MTVIAVLNVWDLSGSSSNVRTIWKVTSSELLMKKQQEKNDYIQKYILKLLLSIFTAIIETVVSASKFYMRMSKKSATCELSSISTPSINSLLLKCCDPN
jgi:hypothetical protein